MFLRLFKKSRKDAGTTGSSSLVQGIDLEMNYCPSCGEEYRAEIDSCPTCTCALISGRQRLDGQREMERALDAQFAGRNMEFSEDDDLVAIRKGRIIDLKSLQKQFAKQRIPSMLSGDSQSCQRGCCGPELYLLVRKEDAEAANRVLTQDFIATTALDAHDLSHARAVFDTGQENLKCPACGCVVPLSVGACPDCGLCFE